MKINASSRFSSIGRMTTRIACGPLILDCSRFSAAATRLRVQMLGSDQSSVSSVEVIQLALTPIFLLTAVAALLNVFSTRLGRVADRVDLLSADLQRGAADTVFLSAQLDFCGGDRSSWTRPSCWQHSAGQQKQVRSENLLNRIDERGHRGRGGDGLVQQLQQLWTIPREPLINLRIMAHCGFDSRATVWTGS